MRSQAKALLLVVFTMCPAFALAQERTYALLSLIGDRLMVVTREMATGSRLDSNTRQFAPLESPELDRAVLRAAESAIRKRAPESPVVLLETRDPAVFAAQAKALDDSGSVSDILPAVRDIAVASKATHLILVTKQRHEAMLNVKDGHIGSGWLEGIGFYIDRTQRLINSRTGEASVGFLAPFAYFRVSLVDLASGKVLAEETAYASMTAGRQSALHPWDAFTAKQKVQMLEGMLRRETTRVIPIVLGER